VIISHILRYTWNCTELLT